MARMEPLLTITVTHDYFEQCSDQVFKAESRMDHRKILGGPRFPFIHTGPNKWSVIGDKDQLFETLAQSPNGEEVEFDLTITDPNFLSYTASYLPDKIEDDSIQIIESSPGRNLIKVKIRITDSMLRGSCHIEKCIHYTSLERYWKFLLILRNPDQVFEEVYLEDAREILSFNRAEPSLFMGKNILKITSSQPVKLREMRNAYSPDLCLYEKRESRIRPLLKHVPAPEPGRFIIREEQSKNEVLQVLYI